MDESLIVPPSTFDSNLDYTIFNWCKKFECKNLDVSELRTFWARNVPKIYSPQIDCDCLNLTYDEDAAQRILFDSLARFITGRQKPLEFLEHLKKLDSPATLCGRVFKIGEATYYCRDCGLDPTCVLCVDCFKNSVHKIHRYKMSMSGGGGYCDCGDEGAWKDHAFCHTHYEAKVKAAQWSDPMDRIPQDVADRARFVMDAVLNYCHEMLTLESSLSLPASLLPSSTPQSDFIDSYATILFNDEVHTYDQVISTLTRAMGCTQKMAMEFATTIDREGRSMVKCGTHEACRHLAQSIEKITSRHGNRPLKVVVTHTDIIAHQTFAMRLMAWLQHILSYSEGFRLIFSEVIMLPEDSPLLESVMLSDTHLWKTARNQWHQLFIGSMHMEQSCKKTFAKVFTKNYPLLMKDFIADDHEHSVSITSLSVQVFTMPLAHTLIEEEDAMSILLKTFLTECEKNRNEDGKLAFERNHFNNNFRRAHYILYDLKYLLTVKPREWSDSMRKHFVRGVHSLLTLLSWMQGMDSVVRQTGQHVEFEAEWETGVNLQLKLASVITLTLEWCGTDRTVLIKALRSALRHLEPIQGPADFVARELADHSASCIDYDVSSKPVTVHIPLSRFIAGLLLHLEKFNLTYDSPEFSIQNQPSPVQLMELPLRTLVLVAQFRAGMWRRNGYSLLNQLFFYQNVRLRDEMFDRDILMLQIAAALIESNEFLIHVLNKYGLLHTWAGDGAIDGANRKTEDEMTRLTTCIAEEFLTLILAIVSERYTPGVGKVDEAGKIKKEIIQLLCIESMTHSSLFKQLPKDPNNETGMENVINEVANFKKLNASYTGKYELKPEFYKEFNPYFYHYTREEQSKAEEVQVKRKRLSGEEECCPPPLPVEFCSSFTMVINLLQCDVMLHLMKLVLQRTLNMHSSVYYSESQFEKVLYLIGTALHDEARQLEKEGKNSFFAFTENADKKNILGDLEECLNCPRTESQKDLLKWTIRKYKSVQALRAQGDNADSSQMDISIQSNKQAQELKKDRKKNAALAAARRERIMAQMSAMQKNFIKEHAELFKAVEADESTCAGDSQVDIPMEEGENPVAIGVNQRGKMVMNSRHTCILCREEQEVSTSGPALVLAAFVQRSTVLSKNRNHKLDKPDSYDPLLMHADLFSGPHTSTCGHVMHSACWQKFFDSVLAKERRRPIRYGRHISFDVDKNEFLCPLCERLSNSVIPLVPALSTFSPEGHPLVSISIHDWLLFLKMALEKAQVERIKDLSSDKEKGDKFIHLYKMPPLKDALSGVSPEIQQSLETLFQSPSSNKEDPPTFHESLIDMMKFFSQATYTVGLNVNPHPEDVRVPLMAWSSCAFTIHAIEWVLRDQGKPIFGELSSRHSHCLQAGVRFAASSLRIFDPRFVRSHAIRLLQYLLLTEVHCSTSQCCLEVDAFSLALSLSLSLPSLFNDSGESEIEQLPPMPLGDVTDSNIVHLIFVFHIVQLLLTAEFNVKEEKMEKDPESVMEVDEEATSHKDDIEESDELSLLLFYKELLTAAGVGAASSVSGGKLVSHVHEGALPFLRCCAMYYHFLTDTPAPIQLQESQTPSREYDYLCRYLGLTHKIHELIHPSSLKQLALSWARHSRVHHLLTLPTPLASSSSESTSPTDLLIRQPLEVNKLVDLPSDYSELINCVSLFTCPNSEGDDSRYPTMCLVCGAVLCSQSYCCQRELPADITAPVGTAGMAGACSYHAYVCGAGLGIFLRIRDCKVLLLAGKTKGCYLAPPYVDDYGETDQGLVRGNPLHLCTVHYAELQQLWLGHNIAEQVARELEHSSSLSATNWQLL